MVFHKGREEIKQIAVDRYQDGKEVYGRDFDGNIRLEYSPESFTGTELDFALDICDGSSGNLGQPTKENPIIINLPVNC